MSPARRRSRSLWRARSAGRRSPRRTRSPQEPCDPPGRPRSSPSRPRCSRRPRWTPGTPCPRPRGRRCRSAPPPPPCCKPGSRWRRCLFWVDQCVNNHGSVDFRSALQVWVDPFGDEPRNSPKQRPRDRGTRATAPGLRGISLDRHGRTIDTRNGVHRKRHRAAVPNHATLLRLVHFPHRERSGADKDLVIDLHVARHPEIDRRSHRNVGRVDVML